MFLLQWLKMSDNGYYKNNIQGAVPDHEKTPEKTGLLNDDDRYTPVANAQPMMVKSDDRGNVQNGEQRLLQCIWPMYLTTVTMYYHVVTMHLTME